MRNSELMEKNASFAAKIAMDGPNIMLSVCLSRASLYRQAEGMARPCAISVARVIDRTNGADARQSGGVTDSPSD
jgi:hypothetical protein